MNKLEAQAYFEQNYDEFDVEELMDIYENVIKHIGFEDNRRDERFVVKFHDIFYCEPEETEENLDVLFEEFCEWEHECLMDDLKEQQIDVNKMMASREVGHYQAFELVIPEITKENAIEVTENIFNENLYADYVNDYVYTANALQNMEDNYMEDWIEFVRGNIPEKEVKEIEEKYKAEKERINAKK